MPLEQPTPSTVKVWGPLIRLFHWLLVLSILLAYISGDGYSKLHLVVGYIISLLLGFRIVWGIFGPRRIRFIYFVKPPAVVFSYLKCLFQSTAPHYLGYNPAGAAMIICLLTSIGLVCMSGIEISSMNSSELLANTNLIFMNQAWMKSIHAFCADLIFILVVLHIHGVLITGSLEGENLVKAMITGRKKNRSDAVDKQA